MIEDETLAANESAQSDRLVLVLEDEADVRQTLCEQLHQLGYLTLEAENGEQALKMLGSSPDIEIFISDLMLPCGMSGAEVIHHVRTHFPLLPVLLVSGRFASNAQSTAAGRGAIAQAIHARATGAGAAQSDENLRFLRYSRFTPLINVQPAHLRDWHYEKIRFCSVI